MVSTLCQRLPADPSWNIQFDRGAGQGVARYALPPGHYEFRIEQGRWVLKKVTYEVTIDNREGTQEFAYVLDNEVVRVKPGESKTHTDTEPVFIEFDRGDVVEDVAQKNLNKSGIYKVAVDPQTNNLDLFATEESADGDVTTAS